MSPIFGHVQLVLVGEPGQLCRDLFFLPIRRDHRHRETVFEAARQDTFEPADMVEIGDNPLAGLADAVAADGDVAGRDIDDLTRMLGAVFEHESAIDFYRDALKAASLRSCRCVFDSRCPHIRHQFPRSKPAMGIVQGANLCVAG